MDHSLSLYGFVCRKTCLWIIGFKMSIIGLSRLVSASSIKPLIPQFCCPDRWNYPLSGRDFDENLFGALALIAGFLALVWLLVDSTIVSQQGFFWKISARLPSCKIIAVRVNLELRTSIRLLAVFNDAFEFPRVPFRIFSGAFHFRCCCAGWFGGGEIVWGDH